MQGRTGCFKMHIRVLTLSSIFIIWHTVINSTLNERAMQSFCFAHKCSVWAPIVTLNTSSYRRLFPISRSVHTLLQSWALNRVGVSSLVGIYRSPEIHIRSVHISTYAKWLIIIQNGLNEKIFQHLICKDDM